MHETPRPTDAANAPSMIERVVREMTAAELEQAGIAADYWPGGPTYYRDGRELDPHERVLLPAVDPVPAYNRGRTFIEPRLHSCGNCDGVDPATCLTAPKES